MRLVRNTLILAAVAALISCGGDLSQQQRERIRESIEAGQIRRVTPAQLTEGAFAVGRRYAARLKDDPAVSDSLLKAAGVRIYELRNNSVKPGSAAARVYEAYAAAPDAADLQDNVQKIGTDTLLYTAPVTFDRPDGSLVFSHAVAVAIPVKWLITSLED